MCALLCIYICSNLSCDSATLAVCTIALFSMANVSQEFLEFMRSVDKDEKRDDDYIQAVAAAFVVCGLTLYCGYSSQFSCNAGEWYQVHDGFDVCHG